MVAQPVAAQTQTMAWQQGYITEHPIDPQLAIVNVLDGQYQVRPAGNCLGVTFETTLWLQARWPDQPGTPFVVDGRYGCSLTVEQKLSDRPCYQTDGVCDWNGD